jgi:hypothetical protein
VTGASHVAAAPAALSRADAVDYYLDWVCWANAANRSTATAFNGKSAATLLKASYRAKARYASSVFRQTALALESPPDAWPANIVTPMADVVTSIRTAMSGMAKIAAATTVKQVDAGMRQYQSSPNSGARLVRSRLGLPQDQGQDNGCLGRGQRPRS